jgi:hypothetical protein
LQTYRVTATNLYLPNVGGRGFAAMIIKNTHFNWF